MDQTILYSNNNNRNITTITHLILIISNSPLMLTQLPNPVAVLRTTITTIRSCCLSKVVVQ